MSYGKTPEELMGEDRLHFHVHQEDSIKICNDFLQGECVAGQGCPLHHTRFPYHWQVRMKAMVVWQSLSDAAQQHLEKLYSDVNRDTVHLLDRNNRCLKLSMNSLKIKTVGTYDQVRRLSSTSDPNRNVMFSTKWVVFWKCGKEWRKYREPLFRELLSAFETGRDEYTFRQRGIPYMVHLQSLTQHNLLQQYVRQVQRRPTHRSLLKLIPHLKVFPRRPTSFDMPRKKPLCLYCGPYPAAFIARPTGDQLYMKMVVLPSEAAYRWVCNRFYKTLPEDKALVLAIHRVRNDHLWDRYIGQKKFMMLEKSKKEKLQLEKHLFYGVLPEHLETICQMNFSPFLSGQPKPLFGEGIYFSLNADFAHRHARSSKGGLRTIFLSKVLVGKTTRGSASFRRPPAPYDSCANRRAKPQLYVIFDNCQCYPFFLISYKLVNDPVELFS